MISQAWLSDSEDYPHVLFLATWKDLWDVYVLSFTQHCTHEIAICFYLLSELIIWWDVFDIYTMASFRLHILVALGSGLSRLYLKLSKIRVKTVLSGRKTEWMKSYVNACKFMLIYANVFVGSTNGTHAAGDREAEPQEVTNCRDCKYSNSIRNLLWISKPYGTAL